MTGFARILALLAALIVLVPAAASAEEGPGELQLPPEASVDLGDGGGAAGIDATGSQDVSWASGSLTASRNGPDISIRATARDEAPDGFCVYVHAEIVRAYATNPDKVVVRNCAGNGSSRSDTWNFTSWAGVPQYVNMKICKDDFGFDTCTSQKRVNFN